MVITYRIANKLKTLDWMTIIAVLRVRAGEKMFGSRVKVRSPRFQVLVRVGDKQCHLKVNTASILEL